MLKRFNIRFHQCFGLWPGFRDNVKYQIVFPSTSRGKGTVTLKYRTDYAQEYTAQQFLTECGKEVGMPVPDWPPVLAGIERIDEALNEQQSAMFAGLLVRAKVIGVDPEVVDLWRVYVTTSGPENDKLPIGTRLRLMEQRLENWERLQ